MSGGRATPPFLHEVLGERFVPAEVAVLLCVAAGVATQVISAVVDPSVPGWRLALAWVLVADVAAGCLANFTAGTNDFYAARPAHRWLFLAVHVHVVAFAWLIHGPLTEAIGVWAYTVVAASCVNLALGRRSARFSAATALVVGALGLSRLDVEAPIALVFGLFYLKVAFAFALDHTAPADAPVDARDGLCALSHRDRPAAVPLIAAAFAKDPLFVAVAGDNAGTREAFAGYLLDLTRLLGGTPRGAFAGGRLVGVSLVHASATATEAREALGGLWFVPVAPRLGPERTWWLNRYHAKMRTLAPAEPHHYLTLVAVAPDAQGRGIGRALVEDAWSMARSDPGSTALALDTENPDNVGLYLRWGFAVTARVEHGDVVATAMVRPAR